MPGTRDRFALAVDFGERRIGVACASTVSGNAQALTTITARAGVPDWDALDALVREWQPDVLILGMPGSSNENSPAGKGRLIQRIAAFAAKLRERYRLPVETVDESLTSAEAGMQLREQRRSGIRKRRLKKGDIDSHSARLIAESWLDGQAKRTT